MTPSRHGLYLQRGPVGDSLISRAVTVPDYTIGDQLLDSSRPHDVQLRPMLPSERTPNSTGRYSRGARMLVFKPLIGMELRAFVHMPSGRRDNTEANVRLAVAELSKFDRGVAKLFEMALEGTSILV